MQRPALRRGLCPAPEALWAPRTENHRRAARPIEEADAPLHLWLAPRSCQVQPAVAVYLQPVSFYLLCRLGVLRQPATNCRTCAIRPRRECWLATMGLGPT